MSEQDRTGTYSDKPGTDWAAKHAAAGSQATSYQDRPQKPDYSTMQPVSESNVVHLPKDGQR